MSDESAIAFTTERDRDAGFFAGLACHVSCRYSQLLQTPEAEISEVISAHLTHERYVVTQFHQAGGENCRCTAERQLAIFGQDLGAHFRRGAQTRDHDVDVQLADDENPRSLQPTHLDPVSDFQLLSIKLLIAFECFWILI